MLIDELSLRTLKFHWVGFNRGVISLGKADSVHRIMIAGAWEIAQNANDFVPSWPARNKLGEHPPQYGFWVYYKPAKNSFNPDSYNANDRNLKVRIDRAGDGKQPSCFEHDYSFQDIHEVWSHFTEFIQSEINKGHNYLIARWDRMQNLLPLKITEDGSKSNKDMEKQNINVTKEGVVVAEVSALCKNDAINDAIYHRWKAEDTGMTISDLQRFKSLEYENLLLKQIVGELTLEIRELTNRLPKTSEDQGQIRANSHST